MIAMLRLVAAALGLFFAASFGAAPGWAQTPEQNEICAEAERLYQKSAGKPSKDEPFVVVLMYKFTFCPRDIKVKQGARVRFINVDRRTSHSVWFKEAGRPESERVFVDEFVEMKVDLPPGEHPYLCGPHWESDKMVGRMIVTGN